MNVRYKVKNLEFEDYNRAMSYVLRESKLKYEEIKAFFDEYYSQYSEEERKVNIEKLHKMFMEELEIKPIEWKDL